VCVYERERERERQKQINFANCCFDLSPPPSGAEEGRAQTGYMGESILPVLLQSRMASLGARGTSHALWKGEV
jgi:hypothetical protein